MPAGSAAKDSSVLRASRCPQIEVTPRPPSPAPRSLALRHGGTAEALLESLCLQQGPDTDDGSASIAAVGQKRGRDAGGAAEPRVPGLERRAVDLVVRAGLLTPAPIPVFPLEQFSRIATIISTQPAARLLTRQMRVLAGSSRLTAPGAAEANSPWTVSPSTDDDACTARVRAAAAALAAAEPAVSALSRAEPRRPVMQRLPAGLSRPGGAQGGTAGGGLNAAVAEAAAEAAAFFAHPATVSAAACAQALLKAMLHSGGGGGGGEIAAMAMRRDAHAARCRSGSQASCCSLRNAWVSPQPRPRDASDQPGEEPPPLLSRRLVALACALVLAYGGGDGGGGCEGRQAKRAALDWGPWGDGGPRWESFDSDESGEDEMRDSSVTAGGTGRCPCCRANAAGTAAGACSARSSGGLCMGAVGALLLRISSGEDPPGPAAPAAAAAGGDQPVAPQARPPPLVWAPCAAASPGAPPRRSPLLDLPPALAAAAAAAHGGLLCGYVATILHGRPWGGAAAGGDPAEPAGKLLREPGEAARRIRHLLVRTQPIGCP